MSVYTPAGYDPRRKQPYPVLYLLHGLFDDADAWTEVGAANVILDNLIAEGKAEPMMMVNTLGYGNADGPAGQRREDMLPNFGRILLEEVLPRVESRYNVSKERVDRAIAGLSMGTYTEVPDVGHVWPFWRQSLADLVPLLFR